jgi:hypothetical protein
MVLDVIMIGLRLHKEASRNSVIMRPTTFAPSVVRRYLRAHKIANLTELKEALGTTADITVFRKLRSLDYLTSYTHRGSYYTLADIARFDDQGLWSHEAVWFSRYGTLLSTIEAFVHRSDRGLLASELADTLHAEVHDALRQLRSQSRLRHTDLNGQFLYTSADFVVHRRQLQTRQTGEAVPVAAEVVSLQVSPHELQTAILLFYSLLDEQQRRLYAGLESIRLGRGGDTLIADFLALDPHTVARGRQQLLDRNVVTGGTRRGGGGRTPTEKKRPQ